MEDFEIINSAVAKSLEAESAFNTAQAELSKAQLSVEQLLGSVALNIRNQLVRLNVSPDFHSEDTRPQSGDVDLDGWSISKLESSAAMSTIISGGIRRGRLVVPIKTVTTTVLSTKGELVVHFIQRPLTFEEISNHSKWSNYIPGKREKLRDTDKPLPSWSSLPYITVNEFSPKQTADAMPVLEGMKALLFRTATAESEI